MKFKKNKTDKRNGGVGEGKGTSNQKQKKEIWNYKIATNYFILVLQLCRTFSKTIFTQNGSILLNISVFMKEKFLSKNLQQNSFNQFL